MTEETLEKLAQDYRLDPVPDYLIYDGWAAVRIRLAERKARNRFWFTFRRVSLAVLFLALIFAGVVSSSQAAGPGNFLYPIKIASQNMVAKVTGDYQRPVIYRTEDVVKSSDGKDGNLDDAIKQYENTINESGTQAQDDKSRQEFKKTLEDGQNQLKQAQENTTNQDDREKIQQAIDATSKLSGEIKGARDVKNGTNDNNSQKQLQIHHDD